MQRSVSVGATGTFDCRYKGALVSRGQDGAPRARSPHPWLHDVLPSTLQPCGGASSRGLMGGGTERPWRAEA